MHLEMLVNKGTRTMGLFRHCANVRSGILRNALILIYTSFIWPIWEFDCIVISSLVPYRLSKLYTFKQRALRLCLGLPSDGSNHARYMVSGENSSHASLSILDRFNLPDMFERRSFLLCVPLAHRYACTFAPKMAYFLSFSNLVCTWSRTLVFCRYSP